MNKRKSSFNEITMFTIGEIVIAGLTVLGFYLLDLMGYYTFETKIIFGAILGCAAITLNYGFLCVAVNRVVNEFLKLRREREMDEDELKKFTSEHSAKVQNTMKSSMMIRTITMAAALIVAFLTGWFDPFATAIPMLAFRPLITFLEIFRRKHDTPKNPDKFIKYDYEDENEEKEAE